MADLVTRLDAYRDAVEARAWDPGQWDCLLAVADWVERLTGEDPGAPFRGRYGGERGAARLVRANGGMVRMLEAGLRPRGWTRTAFARNGDVGAVRLPGAGRRLHGAVAYGGRWLIACSEGALLTPAAPTAVWTHPAIGPIGA